AHNNAHTGGAWRRMLRAARAADRETGLGSEGQIPNRADYPAAVSALFVSAPTRVQTSSRDSIGQPPSENQSPFSPCSGGVGSRPDQTALCTYRRSKGWRLSIPEAQIC